VEALKGAEFIKEGAWDDEDVFGHEEGSDRWEGGRGKGKL
jgi:hypothetical protein